MERIFKIKVGFLYRKFKFKINHHYGSIAFMKICSENKHL